MHASIMDSQNLLSVAHLCRRALSHKKVYIWQQAQEFDTPFFSSSQKMLKNNNFVASLHAEKSNEMVNV